MTEDIKWFKTHCSRWDHGGFDNDPATMNAVVSRILGSNPNPLFVQRDLDY